MAINGNGVAGGCSGSLLAPTLPVSAATNEGIRWQKKKKDDHRGGLGWLDVLLNREENRRVVAPFSRRKQQQIKHLWWGVFASLRWQKWRGVGRVVWGWTFLDERPPIFPFLYPHKSCQLFDVCTFGPFEATLHFYKTLGFLHGWENVIGSLAREWSEEECTGPLKFRFFLLSWF